jgi:hypothetical protein
VDIPDNALPEFEFDTDSLTPVPIAAGLESDEELPEEAFPEPPIREGIGLLFVWMWSVKIIDISNQNFSIYILKKFHCYGIVIPVQTPPPLVI